MDAPTYVSLKQIAIAMRVPEDRARELVRRGEIPSVRVAGETRVLLSDFEMVLVEMARNPVP